MRDQPQPSKLGRAAAAPVEPSKFVKATLGARVLEPWRIPRLDLDVTITLVPHWRASMIEADVIEQLERKLKIELNASTEMEYEAERAAQFCADAFLDPESVKKEEYAPIGTLADWRNLDREVLAECWRQYAAVRVAYDPVSLVLGDDEIEAIEDAIKKKAEDPARSLALLRLYGVRRLSSYLLHSADRLFPSPTPKSSAGESSADTSGP